MRIGILSDSHDHAQRVRSAIRLLDTLDVGLLVHCGDVGGTAVFDEFVGRNFRFVWGNTDRPDGALRAYLATTGLPAPRHVPLRIEQCDKTIEVFHGHEAEFRRALSHSASDYIFHGHTHIARDERYGATRVVNPGALVRARVYTIATLDLAQDVVEFHELPRT